MDAPELRVYVVWMPILKKDSEELASEAAASVADPRATHHWNPDRAIGRETSRALRITGQLEVAWDLFLIYGPEARWSGPSSMPEPSAWMHRLTSEEDPRWMTKERLARVLEALLP